MREFLAVIPVLILVLGFNSGKVMAAAAPSKPAPISPGRDGQARHQGRRGRNSSGQTQGKLTVAQHFALDPGWLDPLEHIYALTQQTYDYLVHDALIKPMPQERPPAAWPSTPR